MLDLSRTFRALADPNRLRILAMLSRGEACVCELQAVLDCSQPFVSRHLAYLRGAELVEARREGARIYYSLAGPEELVAALGSFLKRMIPLAQHTAADLAKLAELRQRGLASLSSRASARQSVSEAPHEDQGPAV